MPAGQEEPEDSEKVVISVAEKLEDSVKVVIFLKAAMPEGHLRELPCAREELLQVVISWAAAKLKRSVQELPLAVLGDHWVEVCRWGVADLPAEV